MTLEIIQPKSDWYQSLVDDCRSIITEAVFTSRWALVEGYHMLGERIVTDAEFQRHAKGNKSLFATVAQNLGVSDRTIYYAVQFYEKFPDLALVPEGKNITWKKLITEYLTEPKDKQSEVIQTMYYHIRCLIGLLRQVEKPKDEKEVKEAFLYDLRNWIEEK